MIVYQITRGLAFWNIDHPELRPVIRLGPLVIAVSATIIFLALPVKPVLVGEGSLSRHLISVFSTLPGFYIAALAAVATFSRPEMDETMPAPAPRMRLRVGNETGWVDLTFRMFLSHLFAFLTTLSFLAVFILVGTDLLSASGSDLLEKLAKSHFRTISAVFNATYVGLAVWLAGLIVLTTLFGLYFLAERIHRPES